MLSILIRSKIQDCLSFFVRSYLPMRQDCPDSAFQMASNVHVIRKQHYYCHTELRQLPLGGTLRMDQRVSTLLGWTLQLKVNTSLECLKRNLW